MDADTTVTLTDPMDFKVEELLKEVHFARTPAITKLVDDTVSAIRKSISKIPDAFPVMLKPHEVQLNIVFILIENFCYVNNMCRLRRI